MMLLNIVVVVQVFILMSGILMALPFFKKMSKHPYNMKSMIMAVVRRYIRLTPSYAMVMLFNSTFLYHLSSGLLWEKHIGLERHNCRNNGCINLIYLNNEFKVDEMVTRGHLKAEKFREVQSAHFWHKLQKKSARVSGCASGWRLC